MNFRSDNTASVAPEILAAMVAANEGAASAYGEDEWSQRLDQEFGNLFEREVRVFPVSTGTAANAVALASLTPPWGAILCHREAHIECDECGAPEFYSGGAKLVLLEGKCSKIDEALVLEGVARNERGVHSVKPRAVSVTQATERGCVYTPEELAALGAAARRHDLRFHMDGARFANAVAALGCRPADISWRGGVDLLSFGATKNGAMAAEALVCFDPTLADEIGRRRKRAGHLISKSRYIAAQLLAYLKDDLWIRLASRANEMALVLAAAAEGMLSCPVQTNQVFITPGAEALGRLREQGAEFYDWGAAGSGEARLVVSWNQPEAEVKAMASLLRSL